MYRNSLLQKDLVTQYIGHLSAMSQNPENFVESGKNDAAKFVTNVPWLNTGWWLKILGIFEKYLYLEILSIEWD